jgi:hypothetical protein
MKQAKRLHAGRWMVVALSLILGYGLAEASAQTENRAGLVIRYGDGRLSTFCIRFGEPSITGLDLFTRSGQLPIVETGGLGAAVCAINGEGCAYPSQPCFCQCQGANCAYWNYFHWIDGAWRYSPLGAAARTITDGAIDGWSWGENLAPPVYTLDQICAESPAAPISTMIAVTPIAAPTDAPVGYPSDTPTASLPTGTTEPVVQAPTDSLALPPAPTGAQAPTVVLPTAGSQPEASVSRDSPQSDLGSYALFAVVVVGLGGWLIVARIRK